MYLSEINRIFTRNDILNYALKIKVEYPELIRIESSSNTKDDFDFGILVGKGPICLNVGSIYNEDSFLCSMALLMVIEYYCKAYRKNSSDSCYDFKQILDNCCIIFKLCDFITEDFGKCISESNNIPVWMRIQKVERVYEDFIFIPITIAELIIYAERK